MVSRCRGGRRAAARSDGARNRNARRTTVGARRVESRRQPRRVRLLHQLQQPQVGRPGRQSSRSHRVSLAEARAAVSRRGTRAQIDAARIGTVFSNAPARKPSQRMGVSAERDHSRTIVSRGGIGARARAFRRWQNSVPAVLGRLPNCRGLYRVVGRTTPSPARSRALPAKGKNLDDSPAGTLGKCFGSHDRVSNSALGVVIDK
jgi:hypothetical protein